MPKSATRVTLILLSALSFALECLFAPPLHAEEPRALPDYDGREEPAATPGEVLLWIPRILLSPVYFVSEFLLRRPVGFLIAGAERAGVPAFLFDFFTFGAEHKAGVIPTAYVDFDFYPSVGLYAFWDDAGFDGHDLRLRGAFGGREWLSASVAERFRFTSDPYNRVAIEASLERRPDFTFFGLGPDSRQDDLMRYGQDTLELRASWDQRLWRVSAVRFEAALRKLRFRRGGFDGDPVLDEAIAAGEVPSPPGYAGGYELLRSTLALAFDSRLPRPAPGSGARLATEVVHGALLGSDGGFIRYGATLGGFIDLNDRARLLALTVTARFADPIAGAEIPFTELITLGGPEPMRGLYPGRLIDRSAVVVGLGYRWPIWIWLDGGLRAEVGNVFGEHLSGLELSRMRWSAALGLDSNGSPDTAFTLGLGVGSETFESGADVNSFRIAGGATHGF